MTIEKQQSTWCAEPMVVRQFRKRGCSDWYDGYPDHTDGGGPYESRTLYTSPPANANAGKSRSDVEQPAQDDPCIDGSCSCCWSHLDGGPAQQEPVAHCEAGPEYCPVCHKELNPEPAIYPNEAYEMGLEEVAFYTSPPNVPPARASKPWVGLTDEERNAIGRHHAYVDNIIRATEAKLKEKNDF